MVAEPLFQCGLRRKAALKGSPVGIEASLIDFGRLEALKADLVAAKIDGVRVYDNGNRIDS
jgi:hypothetical protein